MRLLISIFLAAVLTTGFSQPRPLPLINPADPSTLVPGAQLGPNWILFEYNKGTIRLTDSATKKSLDDVEWFLYEYPNLVIEIAGHTDARGSDRYSIRLSQQRAESILDYLVYRGINPERLIPKGYEESRPIIPEEDIWQLKTKEEQEAAHQRNRRIEFIIRRTDFPLPFPEEVTDDERYTFLKFLVDSGHLDTTLFLRPQSLPWFSEHSGSQVMKKLLITPEPRSYVSQSSDDLFSICMKNPTPPGVFHPADTTYIMQQRNKLNDFRWDTQRFGFNPVKEGWWQEVSKPYFTRNRRHALIMYQLSYADGHHEKYCMLFNKWGDSWQRWVVMCW